MAHLQTVPTARLGSSWMQEKIGRVIRDSFHSEIDDSVDEELLCNSSVKNCSIRVIVLFRLEVHPTRCIVSMERRQLAADSDGQ